MAAAAAAILELLAALPARAGASLGAAAAGALAPGPRTGGAAEGRPLPAGLGLLAAAAALWAKRLWDSPRNVRWVPGMLPFLGAAPQMTAALANNMLLETLDEWHKKLGLTFAYRLPGRALIATGDPRNIEHVLKTNFENYVKGSVVEPFADLFGAGIFMVDGDQWRSQRRTASHMFTKKQFESHIMEVLARKSVQVASILDAQRGDTFDMFGLMNRLTLDSIAEIGFSGSIGSLEDPSSPFLHSFDRVQKVIIERFWNGWLWKLRRLLRLGGEGDFPAHIGELDGSARAIVRDLVGKAAQGEDNSFVGLFIKDWWKRDGDADKQESFMRDVVISFLVAGRDTTAQCMSWTLFELTQHPEVVLKVREEINKVCGDGPVLFNDIGKLRYLQAVLNEGLRLHPSVPYDLKVCCSRDVLPDGTVVPAGCIIQYMPYVQGRSEQLWGPDAAKFRPERWAEMAEKPSTFQFTAFNAGPRECLGRRLAEIEMVAFMATLLRDFDFRLEAEPASIRYDLGVTLGMGGLPLSAKRLRRGSDVAAAAAVAAGA